MAVISCAKYLHDLHAAVIKISSFFFILSKKTKRVYRIFLYHCTGWLKIKYPTGEYAISPQPVV